MSGKEKQAQTDSLDEYDLERNRRKIIRRRKKRIIKTVFFLILMIAVICICVKVFIVAKNIEIINNTPYSNQELLKAIDISEGSNLLGINSKSIMPKLHDYPYVKDTVVNVKFPTTVKLTFNCKKAVYCLDCNDGYLYLDSDFVVLEKNDKKDDLLLLIEGIKPEGIKTGDVINKKNAIELQVLDDIISEFKKVDFYDNISKIDFSKTYNIKVMIDNVIIIELGTGEDLDKKTANAKKIFDLNDKTRAATINVKDYHKCRYYVMDQNEG